MAVCDFCKNRFEESEAKTEFERQSWMLHYENLRKCLCASCALNAIDRKTPGVYFETCGKCGKEFDVLEDARHFGQTFQMDHERHLRDTWTDKPLCADCATAKIFGH